MASKAEPVTVGGASATGAVAGSRRHAARLVLALALLFLSTAAAQAQYLRAQVASYSTSSAAFVDVPGGSLVVRPANAAEVWCLTPTL